MKPDFSSLSVSSRIIPQVTDSIIGLNHHLDVYRMRAFRSLLGLPSVIANTKCKYCGQKTHPSKCTSCGADKDGDEKA